MKRTTLSLLVVAAVLVAALGIAAASAPSTEPRPDDTRDASAQRMPVQRTTLTCPEPTTSELGATRYTAFTPDGGPRGGAGKAQLVPADGEGGSGGAKQDGKEAKGRAGKGQDAAKGGAQQPKPVAPLSAPGRTATADTDRSGAPALIGTADGALAPGYTVQQTTTISAGPGRGVLGTSCTAPDAEFWFAGVSTARERQDYVHLTNPDATPAVVDLELHGRDGQLESPTADGITVPAHATVPVLLSTLTPKDQADLTLHVVARAGRVGAALQAVDTATGSDWLPASADPAGSAVLPGLPADTASARLVVFVPGDDDADLKVRLATPSGSITPAGHETVHVKSGLTTAVDLGRITQGEASSLVLTPADPKQAAPVVAGLRIVRGKGGGQDMAFLAATGPVEERATAADNRAGGAKSAGSTLFLTAPGRAARVKVTTSATAGGEAVAKTVQVRAGTTLAMTPPKPSGKGSYAVTVEPVSGGAVHASRMLSLPSGGLPMFTIQPLPDDRGTVAVPNAEEDLSVLGAAR